MSKKCLLNDKQCRLLSNNYGSNLVRFYTQHIKGVLFGPHQVKRYLRICAKSYCACAKYHPGPSSPLIHSVISNDSVSRQGRPRSDYTNAQADLELHCLQICLKIRMAHMPTLSLLNFLLQSDLTKTIEALELIAARTRQPPDG